jgi:hypothetical protein
MVLAAAPHIDICCSFWESFSFTPRMPSDLTIDITRMAERIYFLSYTKGTTRQNEYRVTSALNGWIVEEIQCSPTSAVHHSLIDKVSKVQMIDDKNHLVSLTPVRSEVKMVECLAVCGLVFSILFAGRQIYHQKYSWRLVFMIVPTVLLAASLIFMRNSFRKNNAFWNAARLMTVVDYARQGKPSIERLLHNPSQYK